MCRDNMLSLAVFVGICCLCAKADTVSFENCGSTSSPISINLHSCNELPCRLVAGGYEDVTAKFVAESDSQTLNNEVYLMLYGIRQNITATPDPCESSDGFCPVKTTTNPYEYTAQVYIPTNMPTINGYIYWRLRDDAQRSLVCYRVAIGIFESLMEQ